MRDKLEWLQANYSCWGYRTLKSQLRLRYGAPDKMDWTSVICDGVFEHLGDPDPASIKRAVRVLEKHMGRPEGSWNSLLAMTLKNPQQSNFWKIQVTTAGGRTIENELVELFEE